MQFLKPHLSKFPKSFAFLADDLQKVSKAHANIWAAFRKHANLQNDDARAAVVPNTGAPLVFAQDLGPAIWGQFDPDIPNRIEIGRLVLQEFEKDSSNPKAQEFLRAKALHEMCHWGCHHVGVPDPDEAGEAFERELFGHELEPWFANGGTLLAPRAVVDSSIFTDPARRAESLLQLAKTPEFMAARKEDPEHKVFGGADVAEGMPRGFRNNNPGNIRVGDNWMGLAPFDDQKIFQQTEKSFGVFKEPEWGLRAIAILLRKYKNRHGIETPRKIIERWAPASDNNDVDSYSGQLAAALGVGRDDVVDANDDGVVTTMMRAIATHENGAKPPYAPVQFAAALRLI